MEKENFINDSQEIIDSLADGIMIVDRKGVIKQTNKAICDMLGYKSKDNMEGQACLAFLGATGEMGEVIDKKNAAFYRTIRYKKTITNEKRQFIKQDGTRIWTNITTAPLKQNKKIAGAIIIITDVTKQKHEEEYNEDFTHTASHNLRSPLGNLLWVVEYLLTKKAGPLTPKQEEYLTDAYESLQFMNRLIDSLLNLSRLARKKIKPNIQKASLEGAVNSVIKDFEHYAMAQKVEIVYKNPTKNTHYVKFDPDHLHSVIQNIVENAIRYAFVDTKITIEIKQEKNKIIFSCNNKGIGVPKDKEDFIFAKFFRAKNAEGKQNDGTGLGMYTSRELVLINKGKIWFKNVPDKEITFYVSLNAF